VTKQEVDKVRLAEERYLNRVAEIRKKYRANIKKIVVALDEKKLEELRSHLT
jgi:hypothetical protein